MLLATARELGIDEVYAVGGAQAIAALAYGTETIPPVAKIVGPGNRFVNEAKLLVCGDVAIDLPAGPSEVLVIADESADAEEVAADLLAQAEHGPDGAAILVTTSSRVADEVLARTNGQVRIETVASLADAVGARTRLRPSTSSCSSPTRPRSSRRSATRAPSSPARPPCSATTQPAPTTCCRPAASPAARAGSAWRRSCGRCSSSGRRARGSHAVRETIETLAGLEGLPLHARAVEVRT